MTVPAGRLLGGVTMSRLNKVRAKTKCPLDKTLSLLAKDWATSPCAVAGRDQQEARENNTIILISLLMHICSEVVTFYCLTLRGEYSDVRGNRAKVVTQGEFDPPHATQAQATAWIVFDLSDAGNIECDRYCVDHTSRLPPRVVHLPNGSAGNPTVGSDPLLQRNRCHTTIYTARERVIARLRLSRSPLHFCNFTGSATLIPLG